MESVTPRRGQPVRRGQSSRSPSWRRIETSRHARIATISVINAMIRERVLDDMPGRLRCPPHKFTCRFACRWRHPPGWWNWQTRRTQNPLLLERAGSSPAPGTNETAPIGIARRVVGGYQEISISSEFSSPISISTSSSTSSATSTRNGIPPRVNASSLCRASWSARSRSTAAASSRERRRFSSCSRSSMTDNVTHRLWALGGGGRLACNSPFGPPAGHDGLGRHPQAARREQP